MLMCSSLPGCVCFRRLHVLHLQMPGARSSADVKQHRIHGSICTHNNSSPAIGWRQWGQGMWAEIPSQTTGMDNFQPETRPSSIPSTPSPPACRLRSRQEPCGDMCAYLFGEGAHRGEGGSVVTHSAPRCDTSDNFNFMPLLWL